MVHASNTSVSSTQNTGNSRLSSTQGGKPWSSRSNSFSSASVVTITRPGSLSSQLPAATGKAPIGVQSPSDTSLLALRISSSGAQMNDQHKRRKSVAVDTGEYGAADAGLGNLNRWSQSTSSSSNTRRSRASGGAILAGLAQQQMSPRQNRINPVDASPRASPNRAAYNIRDAGSTPVASPERERSSKPNNRTDVRQPSSHILPPLRTAPSAPGALDDESPSTASTDTPITSANGTSSTQSTYASSYFGSNPPSSPQQVRRDRPGVSRMQTAPAAEMQQLRHTSTEDNTQARHRSRNSTILDSGSRPTPDSSDADTKRHKTRDTIEREKKAMLSRALQKANTAVLLDNAQNFEGALAAYSDACRLLHMVMERTNGEDDKVKLNAIKKTYTKRIRELRKIEEAMPVSSSTEDQKDLPARPMSNDSTVSKAAARASMIDEQMQKSGDPGEPQMTERSRPINRQPFSTRDRRATQDFDTQSSRVTTNDTNSKAPRLSYARKERDSFFASTIAAVHDTSRRDFDAESPADSRDDMSRTEEDARPGDAAPRFQTQHVYLPPPIPDSFTPAPLSPRRPPSPKRQPPDPPIQQYGSNPTDDDEAMQNYQDRQQGEDDDDNAGSSSWLNTIDESASECSVAESVHSLDAEHRMRRKQIRRASLESNPDFDAAFDAAVEAAYNEGYEPDTDALQKRATAIIEERRSMVQSPASVEEMIAPFTSNTGHGQDMGSPLDDEEEERLLADITEDYARAFNFEMGMKSALPPRQSDSSSYTRSTRSTWQSSQLSDRHTANTSLSTVGEESLSSRLALKPAGTPNSAHTVIAEQPPALESLPPPAPPPTAALPRPPSLSQRRASSIASEKRASTVRSRRLSGQATKPLSIETVQPEKRKRASTFHHHNKPSPFLEEPDVAVPPLEQDARFGASLEPSQSDKMHEHILQSPPSLELRPQTSHASGAASLSTFVEARRSQDGTSNNFLSANAGLFRKNNSSLSLRDQHPLLSSPDDSLPSAITPLSASYLSLGRQQSRDLLSAPQRPQYSSLGASQNGVQHGLLASLLDTSISDALGQSTSPRSPNLSGLPVRLEPCPESSLLRPFWLLRTVSQTIVHPRGGFITTQLFVPREVWQTQNVKLKAEEEKISQCDLLTAALGRLSNVDSYDADALAEELQSFEGVMERMQAALVKKLGNEVGVHSVSGMFKDAAVATSGSAVGQDSSTAGDRTSAKTKESKSFSWRKLRSKSSGAPLATGSGGALVAGGKASHRDLPGMSSVPMTSFMPVERRGGKKDARNMTFEGPHKEYMGSLARLCESAQVLDQIARQVEDPGLKHSSPAHVGLELSIRHAAEFFGFYVCRFVLADLGVLLDKFVKRGTEWVLA